MERSARARHDGWPSRSGRTRATTTMQWLEELVASDAEQLTAWRNQAVLACEHAVRADQRARGNDSSVAPRGEC